MEFILITLWFWPEDKNDRSFIDPLLILYWSHQTPQRFLYGYVTNLPDSARRDVPPLRHSESASGGGASMTAAPWLARWRHLSRAERSVSVSFIITSITLLILLIDPRCIFILLILSVMSGSKEDSRRAASDWRDFFWNPRTHELLGRTGTSWGECAAQRARSGQIIDPWGWLLEMKAKEAPLHHFIDPLWRHTAAEPADGPEPVLHQNHQQVVPVPGDLAPVRYWPPGFSWLSGTRSGSGSGDFVIKLVHWTRVGSGLTRNPQHDAATTELLARLMVLVLVQ